MSIPKEQDKEIDYHNIFTILFLQFLADVIEKNLQEKMT